MKRIKDNKEEMTVSLLVMVWNAKSIGIEYNLTTIKQRTENYKLRTGAKYISLYYLECLH